MLHSIFFISNHRFNINIFHALKNMCFHIRILLFKLSDELLNLYSLRLILFIVTCRTCICELACTLDKAKIIIIPPCLNIIFTNEIYRSDELYSFLICTMQLRHHCLNMRSVKHSHQNRLNNIIIMMTKRDLITS